MVFPSYFTGREDEISELRDIYESTRQGAAGHIIIYGPKGIGNSGGILPLHAYLYNNLS